MQRTYSVYFDGLEEINANLDVLVSQGFKIIHFQVLEAGKYSNWNFYMAVVYEPGPGQVAEKRKEVDE